MNAQVLQNNPNNKRIKSQIYDSDAEYSIIPRGSFPNEEIMVIRCMNIIVYSIKISKNV